YEKLINKLNMNPQWKSFIEKFKDGGLKDVNVASALEDALYDSLRADRKFAAYISPQSFVFLLDHLLLMRSFSSRLFYTTKSTFVGSFTHIHSASTLSTGPSSFNIKYILSVVYRFVHDTMDTLAWIRKSSIDGSFYQLLILKMVMILSLICLKLPEHSTLLLVLLSGYDNFAYLLPKKFVSDLLKKRKDKKLNLDPEVVAEAFISIDDPLVIVSLKNVNPKIEAPCAIFVDLQKSKEEIMNVLFPSKNKPDVYTSSNNDDAGTIPEVSSSNTLPDGNMNMNRVARQMNWKVLEDISKAINGKRRVALNKLSTATLIKDELEINKGTLATALVNLKSFSDEDISVVCNANNCLKVLSFACETSRPDIKESDWLKDMEFSVERLQHYRPRIDDLLKNCVMSQESKVVQTVVPRSSCTTEVEETGDKDSPGGMLSENHSSGDNTRDARNKKGKGNNKAKKSKKNQDKKK
nr:UvrD-like helicase, ATP-binding domain, P-loop containing nucleoside triphosphate hydrolase [Tanacetum cinerariifolium]